jgi:adenylylsulfate kinase
MILIQLTGLSGSGKSTIANNAKKILRNKGFRVEVIDGDEYREHLCKGLGFSKTDRNENIRRLGFVGSLLARNGVIAILAAINPYEDIRIELKNRYPNVRTVWIDCDLQTLIARDTKGIYKRALYSNDHPDKIFNLTGVNDPYEAPTNPDLAIHTNLEETGESTHKLVQFILMQLQVVDNYTPAVIQ